MATVLTGPEDNLDYGRWIALGNGYKVVADTHVAWDDISEFLALVPEEKRHKDMVIWAYLDGKPRQYQFMGGVTDADIKLVMASGPIYPVYADNDAALLGGLVAGDFYVTSTGAVMQVFEFV